MKDGEARLVLDGGLTPPSVNGCSHILMAASHSQPPGGRQAHISQMPLSSKQPLCWGVGVGVGAGWNRGSSSPLPAVLGP